MPPGITLEPGRFSPYLEFNREDWKKLRNSTPLTLSEKDLEEIKGINERISLDEVRDIYLPISRLLLLYYKAARTLYMKRKDFLGTRHEKITFIIGLAGSVAVGKSTTARLLKTLISAWPGNPDVALIPTDGFIYPNKVLEERNLMNRKGFPESYNVKELIDFLYRMKSGEQVLKVPVYSHLLYDIVPDQFMEVNCPDILILEGLNVLQTRAGKNQTGAELLVSDFFDFSIYLDAEEEDIKQWYVERFRVLMRTAFSKKESYFHDYSLLDPKKATETASRIWDEINAVNLRENIEPTKFHAHLILRKSRDHSINNVMMRKI